MTRIATGNTFSEKTIAQEKDEENVHAGSGGGPDSIANPMQNFIPPFPVEHIPTSNFRVRNPSG